MAYRNDTRKIWRNVFCQVALFCIPGQPVKGDPFTHLLKKPKKACILLHFCIIILFKGKAISYHPLVITAAARSSAEQAAASDGGNSSGIQKSLLQMNGSIMLRFRKQGRFLEIL